MSGGAGGGAAHAAAALALLALAHGAPPRASQPAPCPDPQRVVAEGAESLARFACGLAPRAGAEPAGAAALLFGGRLDPNRATPRALEALPGIGPARAAAIASEARVRPFCAAEDLERVPGIGPGTRARLAGWIEAGPGACAE